MGIRGVIVCSTFMLSLIAVFIVPANGLQCYQCASINNTHIFQCNEYLKKDISIVPQSCDNVYGARFCVKEVGRISVLGLKCYQCSSAEKWTCQYSALTITALKPENCNHIYDAKYCIKTIGLHGGGIGTRRYCSSADHGNRCTYVKYDGDPHEYRTCIYTCSSDGCNSAITIMPSIMTLAFSISTVLFLLQR